MVRAQQDFITENDAPEAVRIEQLIDIMRPDFGSEMRLMVDYMRGKTKKQVAEDSAMALALETYRKSVAAIVGEERVEATLSAILGHLLLEFMSGKI
jgi:hypothetical protein